MKMIIEVLIVLFALILAIVFLLTKVLTNKINIIKIKITKAEKKLTDLLKEKFELTLKEIDFLNDKKNFDENLYHSFLNIDLKNITLNNLNDLQNEADNNIKVYLSQNEKLINHKDFRELNKELNNLNITINATRKYYNENAKEFNKVIKKFPTSIVAKMKKEQSKDILNDNEEKKLKILN